MQINLGDVVVYKSKGIYKVEDVGVLDFTFVDRKKKYYTLQSMGDSKDRAYIPTDDKENIRRPLTKNEALDLIHDADNIRETWVKNGKTREQDYKACISNYNPKEWAKVLRTLYKRAEGTGGITSIDKKYQQILENALYSELSYVLGISANKLEKFMCEEANRE
ncbi:CarD family transcriptional regulator [Clostridium sp. C105KSO13]|uniref:CarD family transcriptional regulator n=1 Tax=Clostridium sp. C105KSO13 TaxID=1776045 RepID=UPI000740809B|nr:CarD family transcriptional regulator [Clostridium sp. C105KSO13]CUX38950.1 CarD-like/TRCF domain protein [Clostridium sp. C105KSO13]